jgi:hypothetical protein
MPALRFPASHAKKIASLLFVQKNPVKLRLFRFKTGRKTPVIFPVPALLFRLLFTCFPHVHTVSVIPEDFARAASFLDS